MIDAVILGATGFGGGELLRLLAAHPQRGTIQAVSRHHAGETIASTHPHLRSLIDQRFVAEADLDALAQSENPVLFAAMPHGAFAEQYRALQAACLRLDLWQRLRVIDLSADFRLNQASAYPVYYGKAHPCPEALDDFVYGLSEAAGERLRDARRIANPGCFATAVQLGMLPLLELGVDSVAVSAITGSSGSGAQASATTHHPTRANDFRAYKMLGHQHEGEILRTLSERGWSGELSFVPHSAPMVRGIFATLQCRLPEQVESLTVAEAMSSCYQNSPFVRIVSGSPRVAAVVGSNFADIGFAVRDRHCVVMVALDNLVKGMAGQAVQNMNLSLGLPESEGLLAAALYP